ncbi:hypothetical protein LINPERHAP2_LOCUS9738 [Linum perenne]
MKPTDKKKTTKPNDHVPYSLFNFSSQPKSYKLYLRCLGFKHNGFWWRIRLTSNQIGFWTMKQLKPGTINKYPKTKHGRRSSKPWRKFIGDGEDCTMSCPIFSTL